ncbi:MAG: NADH-quinone oxidoreductase subunit L [Robiginitomaculum sp.]|nr:NADH-quinone oxidoreductase subunit L [Robiginitomaculum sp.]MDQ7078502.1 NADH-quinone oxidoreductase subunit L [Robiginitomaculum sp.]
MYLIIVFGPLLGALIAGLFGRIIGDRVAQLVTTGLLILSAGLSLYAFKSVAYDGHEQLIQVFNWFSVGDFKANWALRVDTLTAVMLVVVTFVSCLVHIYSWGYMAEDPHKARFFAYLSFFTFAMLMLVTANNFLQMFFGWEGVGLASYLLIGFWYKKPEANAAAIKAFVTNRVGDFGFALGIFTIFAVFGAVDFDTVFAAAPDKVGQTIPFLWMHFNAIELIAFLLFIGAMGKSAQFFLHVWLPDAMEGPTPVSALIHAATMVTAGVFLVARAAPIFDLAPHASLFVTVIGGMTAFFAATIGLVQNDIKRVIAYSTCSQLGYMFMAGGLGLYDAAIFHLFTHAFFKALLFLGAGSVIIGMHHEQDMRKMGGIAKKMPLTWIAMIIGTIALTGVGIPGTDFGFAGFFSKDAIIEGAWEAGVAGTPFGYEAFWIGVVAALMTSFYSWRVIFMTFHGTYRGPKEVLDHAHESPRSMLVPLALLSAGAIFAGVVFAGDFIGDKQADFWRGATVIEASAETAHGVAPVAGEHAAVVNTHEAVASEAEHEGGAHHVPTWVAWTPFVVTLIGFLIAWYMYITHEGLGARLAANSRIVHPFLYNKWYFDEIYDFVLVRGARKLGDLFWKTGDQRLIDGFGPNGFAATTLASAKRIAKLQTGFLYHYAFVMLLGLVGFVTWVLVSTPVGGH